MVNEHGLQQHRLKHTKALQVYLNKINQDITSTLCVHFKERSGKAVML
jgi:hypothetical protein